MNSAPIYLTRDDHAKLRLLLATLATKPNSPLQKLREELDRAAVLDPAAIPPDVITLESTVAYEDLSTGEVEEYTLTFPDRANIDQKRLSILAPIGTALIGYRVGDVIDWSTPGGLRQLKIRSVTQPNSSGSPSELPAAPRPSATATFAAASRSRASGFPATSTV